MSDYKEVERIESDYYPIYKSDPMYVEIGNINWLPPNEKRFDQNGKEIKQKNMKLFKNFGGKQWFAFMTVFAFLSVISFFQINSYWADTHNFNGGWTILGIVFGLAAIFGLYKVSKTTV